MALYKWDFARRSTELHSQISFRAPVALAALEMRASMSGLSRRSKEKMLPRYLNVFVLVILPPDEVKKGCVATILS